MKTLLIFFWILAILWMIADIIYFIVISKMKDEAVQDIEKARGIIEWYEKLSKWDAALTEAQSEFDEMLAKNRDKISVSADQAVEAIRNDKRAIKL